jgi:hypothetical protein
MRSTPVWIGVDGGATKLALYRVEATESGALSVVGEGLERTWPRESTGSLATLEQQRSELESAALRLTPREEACALSWPRALAQAVADCAGGSPVVLGLCMPGRKTPDARGIELMANGPRLPVFSDDLERELAALGVTLSGPLPSVASDGQAAGWGEELALGGHLAGVRDALVLGLGTGLAEAVKLGGQHLSPREIGAIHSPAHERALRSLSAKLLLPGDEADLSVERAASLGGMQRAFGARRGEGRLLEAAVAGDGLAAGLLRRGAETLAAFLLERVHLLEGVGAHEVLVVLGQRAALLDEDRALRRLWSAPLCRALELGGVPRAAVRFSRLRAAPAIGAVGAALGLID